MSLVKRTELNRPLTHREVDSNFEYVDVSEWAPRTYLKGQKVYTLGNNGIFPIYICLVNHDDTSYTLGAFNEYGLVNGVNTKLWLKTGADTFTGVITGVTVNATYQAYTGSTITGNTINLKGHNISNANLDITNSITNTYKAYTGITTNGSMLQFFGHNTSPSVYSVNLESFVNTNYKAITGITQITSGGLLQLQGHNLPVSFINLEPIINTNYKAITGITQITNNLLQFSGHNLPSSTFDIGTIVSLNYKAVTGVSIVGGTNLQFLGHNITPISNVIQLEPIINQSYKSVTGATLIGTNLQFFGHNQLPVIVNLSSIAGITSYKAITGITTISRGLSLQTHNMSPGSLDLSNPVRDIYKSITGVTLAGTNLQFFGHNQPTSIINLAGIVTGGTSGTGKTESVYTTVLNLTGSILPKGSVVNIYDAQGGVPLVKLSNSSQSNLAIAHGLITNDIANGSTGQLINYGLLSGLTLNVTYNVGDVLYLSDVTSGDTTNTPSSLLMTSRTIQVGRVIENGTPGTVFVDIVSEDVAMPITANERKVIEGDLMSTGVYKYQQMSSGGGATFDVSALKGWVTLNIDTYSDTPNVTYVDFPGAISVTSPYIATHDSTYVFVTTGSSVHLQTTFPSAQDRRNMLYLGRIDHSNRTTVQYIDNTPDFVVSSFSTLRDVLSSVKLINIGVKPIAQLTNLNISYTSGSLYGNGINWLTNRRNPNKVSIVGAISPQLKYSSSLSANYSPTLNIDPTKYEPNGAGVLSTVSLSTQATNQRIYMSPSGFIWIQYGQQVYSDLITAVLNIQREEYVEHSVNRDVNILIGAISILASATDLTDRHQAIVHTATKTGDIISNLISVGFATSLQQAYNNSSNPEIITDPVLGAVSIRQGSGADIDPVLEIRNGVNTTTASITGAGGATFNNLTTNTLSVFSPIADDTQTQVLGIDVSGVTYRTTLDNLIRNNYLAYTGSSMSGNIMYLQGHNIPGVSFDISNSITDTYKAFTGATLNNSILSFITHNITPLSLDFTNTVKANYTAFTGATLVGNAIKFSGHSVNQTLDLTSIVGGTITGVTLHTILGYGNKTDRQILFTGTTGQTRTQIDKGSVVLFSDNGNTTLDFYVSTLGDQSRITYQNSNGFYTRLYALSPSANRSLYYPDKNGTLAIEGDYKAFTGVTLAGYLLHFSGHNINQTIDLTVLAGGITGLTPGSVLFGDPSGSLGENNSDFFWDDAISRLSITNSDNPLNLNNPSAGLGMYVSLGVFDPNYMGIHVMGTDEGLAEYSSSEGRFYYAVRKLRYNLGDDVMLFSGTTFRSDAAIETINSHVFAAYDSNSSTWTGSTLLGYDGLNVRTPNYVSKFQGGLISTKDNVSGGTLNIIFDPLTGTKTQKHQNRSGTLALLGDYTAFTGATLIGTVVHFSGHNGNQTLDLAPIAAGSYYAYTGSSLSGNIFNLSGHNVSPVSYDFTNAINNTYKSYTGATYNTTTNALTLTGHNVTSNVVDFATGIRNLYKSYTGATLFGSVLTLSGHGISNVNIDFTNTIKSNYKAFTGATLIGTVVHFSGHNGNQTLNLAALAGGGVSGLTPGSVLFANSGGSLGENNTDFFWDDILGQLQINNPLFTTQITGGSIQFQDNILGGSLLVKIPTGATTNTQYFQNRSGTLALLGDYTAFTGATLVGNTIKFSGHSVNQTLDLTSIVGGGTGTYYAYTGSSLSGNILALNGHNVSPVSYDFTNAINNTYKSFTGGTVNLFNTGVTLTLNGHGISNLNLNIRDVHTTGITIAGNILSVKNSQNVDNFVFDITNPITSTYKSYTGATITNNILTFVGHNISNATIDISNAITNTYKSYTGSSLSGAILTLNGHGISNVNYDITNAVVNIYKAFTGATLVGNAIKFSGHSVNQTLDLTPLIGVISYKAFTGGTLSGAVLTLNGHGVSNGVFDFTNAINSTYKSFTGVTLNGDLIKFSGHSVNQTLDLTSSYGAFDVANLWLKPQRGIVTPLTYGVLTTPDFSTSNHYKLVLTGNTTLDVPTNIVAGQSGIITIKQDITGSRTMAYGWCWEFAGGSAPVLTTAKGAKDQLSYVVNIYKTSTVTISNATPAVITWTSHGLDTGDRIRLTTTGGLPTGLNTNITYWITKIDDNSFKVSNTLVNLGVGSFINTTTAGTGVHTATAISITLTPILAVA